MEKKNRLIAFNIVNTRTNTVLHNKDGVPGLLYLNENDALDIGYFIEYIKQYITAVNYKDICVSTIDYKINDNDNDDFNVELFTLKNFDLLSSGTVARIVKECIVDDIIKELQIPSIKDINWFVDNNSELIITEDTVVNFIRAKLQDYKYDNDTINSIITFVKNEINGKQ